MFNPRYTITDRILANIKRINSLVNDLNNRRFPSIVLVELEKTARAISTYASTSIEGNPLPLTEVKKILKSRPAHIRDSEKEVLNYNQALQDLNKLLEQGNIRLSLGLILKIQRQVTVGLLPKFESGKLREKQVVVNDPKTRRVLFLPPDAKDVRSLLENLIEFVNDNRNKIDALILSGIFHKQMVIIHPFMDGNGRATRLATKVLLAQMGLNTFNLFSFENYYNKNVTKYFQTVGEYGNYYELARKIDFTNWLEYFTQGLAIELSKIKDKIENISVDIHLKKKLGGKPILLTDRQLKIIEYIQKTGYLQNKAFDSLFPMVSEDTILNELKGLQKSKILRKVGITKAAKYIMG